MIFQYRNAATTPGFRRFEIPKLLIPKDYKDR
jgi:hypothetical protein